ncbi:MAG TPA: glycosyltransferase, partial [Cyclobacteriaceae bacterium]|nr:glycosyltransferase [Cyclobacteriaceae bacterium]
ISEPDQGIYDAMNKAVRMATGDIIGIINSDDFYTHKSVISKVVGVFNEKGVDATFGDLTFVDPKNLNKVVRHYYSSNWNPEKFAWGFMPAHPTFFVRKKGYEVAGLFKTNYKIAADYEMLIRMLYVHKLSYTYIPENLVVMRRGGVSSNGLTSNIILNKEILRACRENGIRTNYLKIYSKYFRKVFELINIR